MSMKHVTRNLHTLKDRVHQIQDVIQIPANHRFCPVCGKEASSKYWNESDEKWVYKHSRRFAASTYHVADK